MVVKYCFWICIYCLLHVNRTVLFWKNNSMAGFHPAIELFNLECNLESGIKQTPATNMELVLWNFPSMCKNWHLLSLNVQIVVFSSEICVGIMSHQIMPCHAKLGTNTKGHLGSAWAEATVRCGLERMFSQWSYNTSAVHVHNEAHSVLFQSRLWKMPEQGSSAPLEDNAWLSFCWVLSSVS